MKKAGIAIASTFVAYLLFLLWGLYSWKSLETEIDRVLIPAEASELTLLDPARKLPSSAQNVRVYLQHFQDSVMLVRFDAPLEEAYEFAEAQTSNPFQEGCGSLPDLNGGSDWWLKGCPSGAKHTEMTDAGKPPPYFQIVVVPNGSKATIWLKAFTT